LAGVAIITGGSRGIGAATCRLAAQAGYDVCVNYAGDEAAARRVADDVEKSGRRAMTYLADVGDEGAVTAMFKAVEKELGRPSALVNNAGIVDLPQPVAEMTVDRLQRIFSVNLLGSFLCAREAVVRMSTRLGGPGGAIVNLSSAAAVLGAAGHYVDYAASKGAIDAMTIGLAREVADEGIRVNAVRPGIIDTEIHADGGYPDRAEQIKDTIPMKRAGTPQEVAETIVWLLSDKASYCTGAVLNVTGGR
jgi:NAD(P)-dependent dehydrogenase (short-subunit alcohol dehydrogenase family)